MGCWGHLHRPRWTGGRWLTAWNSAAVAAATTGLRKCGTTERMECGRGLRNAVMKARKAVGGQGKAVDRQWKGSERSRKGRVMADLVAPRSLNPLVGLLEISLGQLRKICTRPRTQSEGAAGGASAVGCRRRWAFHWLDYAIMLSMCEVAQWTELKDSLVSQPFQSLHHQQICDHKSFNVYTII